MSYSKKIHKLCALFVGSVYLLSVSQSAFAHIPELSTEAKQAVLIDLASDQILLDKNSHERMTPSSMTKTLALYVVFDHLRKGDFKLEDEFLVSETAWRMEGSRSFLNLGDRVSVENLIRGVTVQSGNDASVALAEGIAGQDAYFASEMNEYARELGLKESNFKNSSGLPDPDQYSTAYDLALVGKALVRDFPEYYGFWGEREHTHNNIRQPNRNLLLYRMQGADGIKTGHTEAGGYGLVASAERGGRRLIAVVNGCKSDKERANEAAKILEWGFHEFDVLKLGEKGTIAAKAPITLSKKKEIDLVYGENANLTIPRVSVKKVKFETTIEPNLTAPIQQGQQVGVMRVIVPDQESPVEIPLLALEDAPKLGFFGRIGRKIASIF